jgi:hypothetical protein
MELQSVIALACYDSPSITGAGVSMTEAAIEQLMTKFVLAMAMMKRPFAMLINSCMASTALNACLFLQHCHHQLLLIKKWAPVIVDSTDAPLTGQNANFCGEDIN